MAFISVVHRLDIRETGVCSLAGVDDYKVCVFPKGFAWLNFRNLY